MKAHVFAEGSKTTAEDRTKPAKEYFQGLFGTVAGLRDERSESADTSLHVLSEDFGVLRGDRPSTAAAKSQHKRSADRWKSAQAALLTAAEEVDVMVRVQSVDAVERTVGEMWPELVAAAKVDSIWCIGAARSMLDSIEFANLEAKGCSGIPYRRVGVARVGTDVREELLQAVTQKQTA